MVVGGDSSSRGYEFESQHRIVDTIWIIFHIYWLQKINCCLKGPNIKIRGQERAISKHGALGYGDFVGFEPHDGYLLKYILVQSTYSIQNKSIVIGCCKSCDKF